MKKNLISLITFMLFGSLSATLLYAQAPEAFVFQGVAVNTKGDPIKETELSIQLFITQDLAYPDGTEAYAEIHIPTTDKHGLFSINIGEGNSVDNFSEIQWADFKHFLCVQVYDDKKLTWVDICNTQLLSVPYSLHAKTVENETDPIYSASQAANITASDITNLDNLSGMNTGDQDLSNVALKSNVLELDNTTAFTPDADYEPATKKYVDDNAASPTTYSIGLNNDLGGYIFYVTPDGKHGLVASTHEFAVDLNWYMVRDLAKDPAYLNSAGQYFMDWRLPNVWELFRMYQQKDDIGGFNAGIYWSSTEVDDTKASCRNFDTGNGITLLKTEHHFFRPIRAF